MKKDKPIEALNYLAYPPGINSLTAKQGGFRGPYGMGGA